MTDEIRDIIRFSAFLQFKWIDSFFSWLFDCCDRMPCRRHSLFLGMNYWNVKRDEKIFLVATDQNVDELSKNHLLNFAISPILCVDDDDDGDDGIRSHTKQYNHFVRSMVFDR